MSFRCWRHGNQQEAEPRSHALGGNCHPRPIESCHDVVLAALGSAKEATIGEARLALVRCHIEKKLRIGGGPTITGKRRLLWATS